MVEFTHSIARVAVWNLAGFNQPSPEIGIAAGSERAEKQAEGLALLDAEVVTLVEVSPLSHIEHLAGILEQKYGIIYKSAIVAQPKGNIHIGVLYKPGVEVTNVHLIEGSQGDYDNGRLALQLELESGKFKAVLLAVHLKSGRGRNEQKLRDSQCKAIGNHIAQLRATPGYTHRTILLMGDFNMIPGQDVSNFYYLGGDDLMDFVSSWDLQDRFSHILKKGRANLLDGFAISRTYSTDYIKGSLRLFPMHWTMNLGREAFKKEVSDHLPFVASFKLF